MNKSFTKLVVASIGISLVTLFVYIILIGGIPIKTMRTSYGTARIILTPKNMIRMHEDFAKKLSLNGKTFQRLRGEPPFYLEIKSWHSLIFVTDEKQYPYNVTIHIYDLESKDDIVIDGEGTGFGYFIGYGRPDGEILTDYIGTTDTNTVQLVIRSLDWRETTTVNRETRKVERVEVQHYGASGTITNTSMNVQGVLTIDTNSH